MSTSMWVGMSSGSASMCSSSICVHQHAVVGLDRVGRADDHERHVGAHLLAQRDLVEVGVQGAAGQRVALDLGG